MAVDFARALRDGRIKRQLTQEQVGKLLEPPIGHSLISRYESGLRPPPHTLIQLAKLLHLELTVEAQEQEAVAS